MSLLVAIVGCGAVAQRLYRGPLQQLEKQGFIKIAAVVDPVVAHAEAIGSFFPHAVRYTGLQTALSATRIDLTLILTPAHLHGEQTIEALRHGSHVLCEKPMASTAADCARMNEAARAAGRVLAIGMIRRFFPAFGELRRLVASGALGTVQSFEYREGHKFEWEVTTAAAFKPRHEGGTGVLFDIGPHALDALAWIFGDLHVRSSADDALAGVETNVSLALQSPTCPGSAHLSWDHPQTNECRVIGDKAEAVLRIDRFDQLAVGRPGHYTPVTISTTFPRDLSSQGSNRSSPRSYAEAIYCQIVQVLRAIHLQEAPAVDGEEGHRCIAVLEAALANMSPLPMPWLSSAEQHAYHKLHWTARA